MVEYKDLNDTAKEFLEYWDDSDSIEVNGHFIRYYNDSLNDEAEDADDLIIDVSLHDTDLGDQLAITLGELKDVKNNGRQWEIGGFMIEFYFVEPA